MKRSLVVSIMAWIILTLSSAESLAVCGGTFFNPLTDVCWECMFPIKMAGLTVVAGMEPADDAPDYTSRPLCICMVGPIPMPGIPMSFWEPARFIETVKDPFCFPTAGFGIPNPFPGTLSGTNDDLGAGKAASGTFAQTHIVTFPVSTILSTLLTGSCATTNSDLVPFAIPYLSEVDPTWNDDMLMAFLQPEAFLFANPIASLSCIADSVASNLGMPLDPLFWCLGSWGSTYPLTGHSNESDYVQANASLAARSYYRLGRVGLVFDAALDPTLCLALPTPIWIKSHYKLQVMKPTPGRQAIPMGRTGIIWGIGKNTPLTATNDNFSWILFRKKACCAF